MKLDRTFAQEVKKVANGDGSQEVCFAFLNPAREAARKLSNPNVMQEFDNTLREYGQATVGLCVAVTVWERRNKLERRMVRWAEEVLKLWINRPHDTLCLFINDGLHPSRIEKYASSFIKLTIEED